MALKWTRTRWRCCGRVRLSDKFCPDCGKKRPTMSDAKTLLAHWQGERDAAERAAQTFRQNAAADAELCDSLSDEPIHNNYDSPRRECECRIQNAIASAEAQDRKAVKIADWCSILSELMIQAGID